MKTSVNNCIHRIGHKVGLPVMQALYTNKREFHETYLEN